MYEEVIQLPDGRRLAYARHGPSDGRPVLYFHGTPSSRLEPLLPFIYGVDVYSLLRRHHLQLIAVDRPGMGRSSFHAQASFSSFARDVAGLLRQQSISRCPVLCWSGGGPYALALAHHYPQLVSAVFVIAGFTVPFAVAGVFAQMGRNKLYFGAARHFPGFMQRVLQWAMKQEVKKPAPKALAGLPWVDYQYIAHAQHFRHLSAITTQEACRYGARGAVHEAGLYFNDFGFRLQNILQPVYYWWGSEDVAVIKQHPKALERQAPQAKIFFKPGEGHLSIYIRFIGEVLQTIAAQPTGAENKPF